MTANCAVCDFGSALMSRSPRQSAERAAGASMTFPTSGTMDSGSPTPIARPARWSNPPALEEVAGNGSDWAEARRAGSHAGVGVSIAGTGTDPAWPHPASQGVTLWMTRASVSATKLARKFSRSATISSRGLRSGSQTLSVPNGVTCF